MTDSRYSTAQTTAFMALLDAIRGVAVAYGTGAIVDCTISVDAATRISITQENMVTVVVPALISDDRGTR